jgi:hypothetical protein
MIDYTQSRIYKLTSIHTDEIYIGSTTQSLAVRKGGHKRCYRKHLKGAYGYTTSFKLFEFGENDVNVELIEKYSCTSKEELIARESHYIRTLDCVNKVIPDRTKQEYRRDNVEKISEQKTKYYQENKIQITEQMTKYYQENKIQIADQRGEKVVCECSCIINNSGLTRHKKTAKHIKKMRELEF